MKRVLFIACILLSLHAISQKSVISDPALGRITIWSLTGQPLNVDDLPLDQAFRIKLPISNFNNGKIIPAGSCKIKMGFGSRLALDPGFSLITADMHEYFNWTAAMVGGQLQLTGELVNPLPAGMVETGLMLKVKGTVPGTSTITANFLLSNHNSNIVLSDSDPTNNSAFLAYTVTGKISAGTVKLKEANRVACKINITYNIDKEIDMSRYEIEVSKDGFSYTKVAQQPAIGSGTYNTSFDLTDEIKAAVIFVRIKAIDKNGAYSFSNAAMVSGNCDKDVSPWVLSIYPNPATDVKAVTIAAKDGMFNGKYKITILDMTGRLVQVKEMQLNGLQQLTYPVANLGSGKYLVQVMNSDGSQSAVLQFEKL